MIFMNSVFLRFSILEIKNYRYFKNIMKINNYLKSMFLVESISKINLSIVYVCLI